MLPESQAHWFVPAFTQASRTPEGKVGVHLSFAERGFNHLMSTTDAVRLRAMLTDSIEHLLHDPDVPEIEKNAIRATVAHEESMLNMVRRGQQRQPLTSG